MHALRGTARLGDATLDRKEPTANPILVVEDEFLVADYVRSVLEDAGYPIAGTAASAAEALAIAVAGRPALALLDVRLSGGDDGVALAGRLRSVLPVVFVSGSGDPKTRARIAAAAPSGFLQKPVSPEALLDAVRSALAS
jgi:CheY-like chemotaxis protein